MYSGQQYGNGSGGDFQAPFYDNSNQYQSNTNQYQNNANQYQNNASQYPNNNNTSQYGNASPYQPSNPMAGMGNSLDNIASFAENPMVRTMAEKKFEDLRTHYLPGASSMWNTLRYYFHVDNRYVLKKIQLLVFPWRHKDWARMRVRDETVEGPSQSRVSDFAPPIKDINAPDMYLPVMAFVTYTLFIGYLKGTKRAFNPEVLQDTFSSSALVLLAEVLLMKGGLYSLGAASVKLSWSDLSVYAGYKYVNVALGLFIGIFLGSTIYTAFMLYFCVSTSFFTFRTMQKAVPKPGNEASGHKRRLYYLLCCAGLQLLTIFFLGFTRDLGESTMLWSPGVADGEADV